MLLGSARRTARQVEKASLHLRVQVHLDHATFGNLAQLRRNRLAAETDLEPKSLTVRVVSGCELHRLQPAASASFVSVVCLGPRPTGCTREHIGCAPAECIHNDGVVFVVVRLVSVVRPAVTVPHIAQRVCDNACLLDESYLPLSYLPLGGACARAGLVPWSTRQHFRVRLNRLDDVGAHRFARLKHENLLPRPFDLKAELPFVAQASLSEPPTGNLCERPVAHRELRGDVDEGETVHVQLQPDLLPGPEVHPTGCGCSPRRLRRGQYVAFPRMGFANW